MFACIFFSGMPLFHVMLQLLPRMDTVLVPILSSGYITVNWVYLVLTLSSTALCCLFSGFSAFLLGTQSGTLISKPCRQTAVRHNTNTLPNMQQNRLIYPHP